MSTLIERLRKRRFPWIQTTAYAGNIASAAFQPHQQSGTFVVDPNEPDADIDDAIKRIEALESVLARVDTFLTNGIALGYIRMPDDDCPDPAKETPALVRSVLSQR